MVGAVVDNERLQELRARREKLGLHNLLTTEETAARTGVSESVLKHGRLIGRKDLPQPVRVGHRVMYRRADVDRWTRARVTGDAYEPSKVKR